MWRPSTESLLAYQRRISCHLWVCLSRSAAFSLSLSLSLPVFEHSRRFGPLLSASFRFSCWLQPTANEYDRPYSIFFPHPVLWLIVHFRLPPVRGSWIGDASCFCRAKLSCRRTFGPKVLHGLWWPRSQFKHFSFMLTHWGRQGSFKLFKRPFPGFLTILTL